MAASSDAIAPAHVHRPAQHLRNRKLLNDGGVPVVWTVLHEQVEQAGLVRMRRKVLELTDPKGIPERRASGYGLRHLGCPKPANCPSVSSRTVRRNRVSVWRPCIAKPSEPFGLPCPSAVTRKMPKACQCPAQAQEHAWVRAGVQCELCHRLWSVNNPVCQIQRLRPLAAFWIAGRRRTIKATSANSSLPVFWCDMDGTPLSRREECIS